MFGMGFGELLMVIVVAVVVIGPKDLPKVLRQAGRWAGKLRRMALDLRVQSGIDDVLQNEGLAADIQEIRKLARGELDGIREAATVDLNAAGAAVSSAGAGTGGGAGGLSPSDDAGYLDISMAALRHREYPREGVDAYGALPDTAVVYVDLLAKSDLARDPLYMMGDANAEMPPEPKKSDSVVPTQIGMPAVDPAAKAEEAPATPSDVATAKTALPPEPTPEAAAPPPTGDS
ncbi:MAG: Sec-independent protein translocase protein TatB [Polyangiaceae bacterium]